MSTNEWWMLTFACLIGLATGGGLGWAWTRKRVKKRLRNLAEELHRYAVALQKSKAAVARLQAELDTSRTAMTRQLAHRGVEPARALARTEGRLKAAYRELDFLRRRVVPDSIQDDTVEGFASTRPMHDLM